MPPIVNLFEKRFKKKKKKVKSGQRQTDLPGLTPASMQTLFS